MAHYLSFFGDQYIALSGADVDLESMDAHLAEEIGEAAMPTKECDDAPQAKHESLRGWVHRYLAEHFDPRH